ncbi:putative pectate lyase [Diplodia seriata]|uniref:Pectate lyase n=2 Tax=Diplodia seriata TaxID=420778 RepID=A0A0G2ECZ0_9PEZI|nr:putative pectate lyase [Diplodia seriata]
MQYSIALVAAAMAVSTNAFMVPRDPRAAWGFPNAAQNARLAAAAATPVSTPGSATTPATTPAATAAASGFPASSGTSQLSEPMTVTGNFDGGMKAFGRGVDCTGQAEGGDSDAVFMLEEGATLSNVIIAADQIEGVHCFGGCTLKNVWWTAVCEDAFTIKEQGASDTTHIIGGGARGAEDKVLQHNGGGTLAVSGFLVEDFGKFYRSCGNCDDMPERHITVDSVTATTGDILVGINSNMGDTATISNTCATGVEVVCQEFTGVTDGSEPEEAGSGPSDACKYTVADAQAC